jgi:hypothetical protein
MFNLVNEPGLIVPFATLILLMPNDATLIASLKLNVKKGNQIYCITSSVFNIEVYIL